MGIEGGGIGDTEWPARAILVDEVSGMSGILAILIVIAG
jgi:hypothetical protein